MFAHLTFIFHQSEKLSVSNSTMLYISVFLVLKSVKFVQSSIAWLFFFFPNLEIQPYTVKAFIIITVITLVFEELQNLHAGFLAILDTTTRSKEGIWVFKKLCQNLIHHRLNLCVVVKLVLWNIKSFHICKSFSLFVVLFFVDLISILCCVGIFRAPLLVFLQV